MEGMYQKFNGNYASSAKLFKQYIDSTGIAEMQFGHIASEVFRKSGQVKEARYYIDLIMNIDPNQSIYLLELARVEYAEGKEEQAKKTITKALEYWKDADPNYKFLLEAKAFYSSL